MEISFNNMHSTRVKSEISINMDYEDSRFKLHSVKNNKFIFTRVMIHNC